jgi:hypothetical protein
VHVIVLCSGKYPHTDLARVESTQQQCDPRQFRDPAYSTPQTEKEGSGPKYSHEGVVHRDNEDLAGILEFGRVDIARDVVFGTRRRESRGNACAQETVRDGPG